jgi:hypothetical protein
VGGYERERSGRRREENICGGSGVRGGLLLARSQARGTSCPSAEAGCFARGLEGAQPRSVPLRQKRAVSLGGWRGRNQGVSFYGGSGLLRSGVVGGRPPEPPLLPARSHLVSCGARGPQSSLALVPASFMWRTRPPELARTRAGELHVAHAAPRARSHWCRRGSYGARFMWRTRPPELDSCGARGPHPELVGPGYEWVELTSCCTQDQQS